MHHDVIVKGVEYVGIDSQLVPNHVGPCFAPVAHGHVALHDVREELAILLINGLAALDGWEEVLDPLVELLLRVLILEVLQVLFPVGKLLLALGIVSLVLLQRVP